MTERPVISARPSTKEWIKVIECYQETLGFASELKELLFFFVSRFRSSSSCLICHYYHNIPPFRVNAINGESIIRYPFFWDLLFSVEGLREGKISGSITCLAFQVRQ